MQNIILYSTSLAFIGIAILTILFLRNKEFSKFDELKKHRSKDQAFSDLLIYGSIVEDGVILNKNGSLTASYSYKGSDTRTNSKDQNNLVSYHLNQAFKELGSGWVIHIDAVRKPVQTYIEPNQSHFPDSVSLAMDNERRMLFEQIDTLYDGDYYLSLTFTPPSLIESKLLDSFIDDFSKDGTTENKTETIIQDFNRKLKSFESGVGHVLQLTRLKSKKETNEYDEVITYDSQLSYIQRCITGQDHKIALPDSPNYLDCLLGGEDLWTGLTPKLGDKFIQTISLEGFPSHTTPVMLRSLSELNLEYRWSTRFIFLDNHLGLAEYEKFRKKWGQKVRGLFDQVFNRSSTNVDINALEMQDDAQLAKAEIESGVVSIGYFTSVVVILDKDRSRLEKNAIKVRETLQKIGYTSARIEQANNLEAYLGSLPAHVYENIRRPLLNTLNLADKFPTTSIWIGRNYAPCPFYPENSPPLMQCVTTGYSPMYVNLHVGDVGHTLIIGPTGSGKSTLLATLAAQYRRYKNMKIYAFDKGMSMYPLTIATGGSHFELASDSSSLSFAPLQFLETQSDRAWAMEWIATILELNDLTLNHAMRNEIANAVITMYETDQKTLSDFSNTVQSQEIRDALAQYLVNGSMGHLLDARSDNLNLSSFTTFEIEELMNLSDKYALPVLLYLFRRIERSLDGSPAAIILDEAWLMLFHDAFQEKILEWLVVLRKNNCNVILATQNMVQLATAGNKVLSIISSSTKTKIFLPNPSAKSEVDSKLYKLIGLNDAQIGIISRSKPKHDYYLVSEEGCRLFNLALQPLQLAFVGVSDKEQISKIKTLHEVHGDEWHKHWLKENGLLLDNYLEKSK